MFWVSKIDAFDFVRQLPIAAHGEKAAPEGAAFEI
jgi:hypothetical protein